MLIRGLILISVLFAPSTLLAGGPNVSIKTNLGEIIVQLDSEKAPITVSNFQRYVRSGSYDGTIFHRVIPVLWFGRRALQGSLSGPGRSANL